MQRPSPPAALADDAIRMRPWHPSDRPALVEAVDDEILYWFDYLPQPFTDEAADELLQRAAAGWRVGGPLIHYAIEDANSGALVGCCSLCFDDDLVDVSYWTHPLARGRGVASRALRLACGWLYSEPGYERAQLRIDLRNTASRQVAERAGFKFEGTVLTGAANHRDLSPVYHAVYRMTRDEFTASKQTWGERAWNIVEGLVLAFTATPVAHMGHGAMTPTVHHTLMHLRTVRGSGMAPSLTAVSQHFRAIHTAAPSGSDFFQQLRGLVMPRSARAQLGLS